ncbi:MAG TPA: LacI family DNA-binding transcriptional regulator [Kiritimatiellia bacterium]|nr:LacI family DNA-binding transcriptional regulator [Kiritimatiellia bacterium]
MAVTQKKIAEALGLSASLVSRALGGKADAIGARPETIARIREMAESMGYVPSGVARRLRGKGKPVIGVMVADIGDPFFSEAASEVIRQGHERGFALAVAGFDHRVIDKDDIWILLEQDLNGLLILGGGEIPWRVRDLAVARIGSGGSTEGMFGVGVDEAKGFEQLFGHLRELGHRQVGWVGANQPVHRIRLAGAKRIAREAGMVWRRTDEALGSADVLKAGLEGGEMLVAGWARRGLPTALICSSDAVALGVIRVLVGQGLRVPEDVSVTGFDDVLLARLASPPLTTLGQPVREMARLAFDHLSCGRVTTDQRNLAPKLVVRGSTGRAG